MPGIGIGISKIFHKGSNVNPSPITGITFKGQTEGITFKGKTEVLTFKTVS
jgi:hypothetical protein